ncbi:MAG: hypothetical protein JXA99_04845 [Candidatus Lokiarchaeota archaeon]|nr:hypothetical protein [Candidatus Lokiarchaeota archaeon]
MYIIKNNHGVIIISRQAESQDIEWARDWNTIVNVFNIIEELKVELTKLDVNYLRELQQKILILNLEKYAWSLQNYIIDKYTKE